MHKEKTNRNKKIRKQNQCTTDDVTVILTGKISAGTSSIAYQHAHSHCQHLAQGVLFPFTVPITHPYTCPIPTRVVYISRVAWQNLPISYLLSSSYWSLSFSAFLVISSNLWIKNKTFLEEDPVSSRPLFTLCGTYRGKGLLILFLTSPLPSPMFPFSPQAVEVRDSNYNVYWVPASSSGWGWACFSGCLNLSSCQSMRIERFQLMEQKTTAFPTTWKSFYDFCTMFFWSIFSMDFFSCSCSSNTNYPEDMKTFAISVIEFLLPVKCSYVSLSFCSLFALKKHFSRQQGWAYDTTKLV